MVAMPRVVITGDRGSGTTTVLALLYAAQVKSGSDVSDAFRFHADIESLDEISNAFQQLMSGSFPDAAAKEGIRGMTFSLGYRRPRLGILSQFRARERRAGESDPFQIILLRDLTEEVGRYRAGRSFAHVSLGDVLESDGVVFVVDCSRLAVADDAPQPLEPYDRAVESLLIAMMGSQARSRRRSLHPIFLFSKFDSVDEGALRAAKIDRTPPDVRKRALRTRYAQALLDRHLPKTMARIRNSGSGPFQLARPSYFFSWVRTEPAKGSGRERVRLRPIEGGGWEPDYARDEYLALLERFWEIGADTTT